jgi:hypothetical protein
MVLFRFFNFCDFVSLSGCVVSNLDCDFVSLSGCVVSNQDCDFVSLSGCVVSNLVVILFHLVVVLFLIWNVILWLIGGSVLSILIHNH